MINGIEKIYENSENVKVHYVGFITNNARYDFAITYSTMFFGKSLLTCLQTGRTMLVDGEDIQDPEHFCRLFNHCDDQEFQTLSNFFSTKIPSSFHSEQY
ncbi:DUF3055 domain-containing protein [Calidifontibacillus erzurumensis]|uniref:DUF3055 domain-containing protein n=1 Tax=Calidifontibacillus erzurumensis TaxID=2741433 RepID=A0A8J8GC99_9BACI|nr:DUF3055 domain-containing protein [Calidifontibacillus erzurumensis]NSL50879.1 DUF3055 domain-containing protein [Calidifontibacillus erzurumensis]